MLEKERKLNITLLALAILGIFSLFIMLTGATIRASYQAPTEVDIRRIMASRNQPFTLPFGESAIFPDFRYVALYGTPKYSALGALGEQSVDESVKRAQELAEEYQPFSEEKIIPTFEIITTVASAAPTKNDDYSQEVDIDPLKPWIEAAYKAEMYVLLDLQPGRSTFLSQAKKYQELLLYPHVGLALDPEWRLESQQVHLQQIGSVSATEVNQVTRWLADLTKGTHLPQKMLLIHQFRNDMITDRDKLDTSREELAFVIQMDGQGTPDGKDDTWRNITTKAPEDIRFGWKNFYDEDTALRSPKDTMKISPQPWYVSYQ